MIPIKLTIEGLYSYQQRQSIDFEKLTSNHLFGIFGTVGSGKSSILEAITFALYGKTDRLLLSGDNRNYNMMNLKSDQLFIEFDFLAGNSGQAYRVQVSAKRNSKKYEDVKKMDRAIYKQKAQDFIPISQEELESTIGLGYDNFKRTIIIPQGKFQEFLQLKSSERTQMMKELFGLQKYELSPKVKSLETQNNAIIQNLSGRLEQLGEISPEQLTALKTHLKQIEQSIQTLALAQKQHDETLQALEKLKENTLQLNECRKREIALAQQKESTLKLQEDIAAYEYCIVHFKNTLEGIASSQQKNLALNAQLKADQASQDETQANLDKLNLTFAQISAMYKTIDTLKKEVEDLNKLAEAKTLSSIIEKETERLKKGELLVAQVSVKLKQIEDQEKETATVLSELKKQQPHIETLNRAQQWHTNNKNIQTLIAETQIEKKAATEEAERLQQKLLKGLDEYKYIPATDNKNHWLLQMNQELQQHEDEQKRINQKHEDLLVRLGLETHALNLKDGAACPLCGSEQHPKPYNSTDIGRQIELCKNEAIAREAHIRRTRKLIQHIEKHIAGIKPIEAQLTAIDIKLLRLHKQSKVHQTNVVSDYRDANQLLTAFNKYKEIQSSMEATDKKLLQLREEYARENKNKEKYQQELSRIEREMDKNVSSKELLMRQISHELIALQASNSSEQIAHKAQELQNTIAKTITEYEDTRQRLEELKKTLAVLQSKIDINKKHLESETLQLSKLQQKLEDDIKHSSYSDTENIISVLNLKLNIDASKQKIQAYQQNHQLIVNEMQRLTAALNNQVYDAKKHQSAIEVSAESKKKLSDANREHGKVENTLTDLTRKLLLRKELNEQLDKLKLRAADIDTLRKLFFKSGFVNYVSSVYLQNLCAAANERFYKMTRQSLSLELNADNSFEVRDYMNGGKLRNVKTLSGGQTFQAALSLALALADNIQNLNQTQRNFFFLDEGFGSLDKDSLQIVFGTLKNLRNENRIVGVISHVEEMQQEIPTFLNITQHPEAGSQIEESWRR